MNIPGFFKARTKVLMADNTFKVIEKINIGDYLDAIQVKALVKDVFQAYATDLIVITGKSGNTIAVTPEQSFMAKSSQKIFAKILKVGDLILCFESPGNLIEEEIINVEWIKNYNSPVYNFGLNENHNFNVNGFLGLDFISQQVN